MNKFAFLVGVAAFVAGAPAVAQHSNGDRHYASDARGNCPPGLAKKNNRCTPPGLAKKTHNVGERYDRSAGHVWTYDQIPTELRSR